MKTITLYFFTIVELLVVISIIVILAGILLPALKRAKDSVQRIACVNKLKQIHIGGEGYIQDYDGWICPGTPYSGRYWYWEVADRIGKNKNFFMCPAEKVGFGAYADGLFSYTHYGINCELAGTGYNYDDPPVVRKASSVTQPSIAIWFVDSGYKSSFASDDRAFVAFRHGALSPAGQANLVYFDGHAKSLKYNDMKSGSADFKKGF
ncbi:MAG: hypothetical protein A2017_10710 [Lentisphaerae bacterium GWF2_44_16]|nr:MAG: hypothetical protein A2017_10710 [Lentisphaerae bacterium GWF2_44_16]